MKIRLHGVPVRFALGVVLGLALGAFFGVAPGLSGQSVSADPEWNEVSIFVELSQPISVETRVGRDFSGLPLEVTRERIVLLAEIGGGSVEYTFARNDIVRVRLPGAVLKGVALDWLETGRIEEGLTLIESLFTQRERFFPYLPVSEREFFVEQLTRFRRHGETARGLRLARALEPWFAETASTLQGSLRDEILIGEFLVGDPATAEALALAWLDKARREANSALGWYVLGSLQASREEADAAWFTWLRPIVFSGRQALPYLTECYVGAIQVGISLGREDAARRLLQEMEARGLVWPSAVPFPEFSSASAESTPLAAEEAPAETPQTP